MTDAPENIWAGTRMTGDRSWFHGDEFIATGSWHRYTRSDIVEALRKENAKFRQALEKISEPKSIKPPLPWWKAIARTALIDKENAE